MCIIWTIIEWAPFIVAITVFVIDSFFLGTRGGEWTTFRGKMRWRWFDR